MRFFQDTVRRRLTSLLQPWLLHDPDYLELQLGFINSQVNATNLHLDTSALNTVLLDDETSASFSFKEVTIEHFNIRFSTWSCAALTIDVHGLNVVLSARVPQKSREAKEKEKEKAIAGFDSEGSELHVVLEGILAAASSRNCFKTSILNTVLKHCHLRIFNASVEVHVPVSNDALVYFLETSEVNVESESSDGGCLLREVVSAVLKPLKEISLALDFKGFGIGYMVKDQRNGVFSSTHMFTCIKLNELQVKDFTIRVPELKLVLTPLDLPVLSAFGKLTSKEPIGVRSGRQLWRLAADRLRCVNSSPRLSLHTLVEFVCLWLRYANAYEHLLSLLAYSTDNLFGKSDARISQDKSLLSTIKHNWDVISSVEKQLPAEAIAQARRIARYRASLDILNSEDSYTESASNSRLKFLSKTLSMLAVIWNVIYRIFLSLIQCICMMKRKFDAELGIDSEDCGCRYVLNLGKFLITFSPTNTTHDANEKMKSHTGISDSDMHSFCLSLDSLLVLYTDKIVEQTFSISCGQLNIKSSSIIGVTILESGPENASSSKKGHRSRKADNARTVLWSEPAQTFLSSQTSGTCAASQGECPCYSLLKKLVGEAWLTWKRASMKYVDTEVECSDNPWLFCEIKNCLRYSGLTGPDKGLWKFTLTVGKLHVFLVYASVLSLALLLGQIRSALNWTEDSGRAIVHSHLSTTIEDLAETSWESKYGFYVGRMKTALLRILPEKHIHLGLFITGPHIQISLGRVGFSNENKGMGRLAGQDDFRVGFDIHNIEAFVCPTSKSDLALTGWPATNDAELGSQRLREPPIIGVNRSDNEKYASQGWVSLGFYLRVNGLDIYMGESAESQIFLMKPIDVQLSFVRESVHSFCATVTAVSASFCVLAMGFSVVSFMDELYVFFQVLASLLPAISNSFGSFQWNHHPPLNDFLRQKLLLSEPENNETTAGEPLIYHSTLLSINGTSKLMSMDVILQNSRTKDRAKCGMERYDGLSSQKFLGHDLADCGIWIAFHQTLVEISSEDGKLGVLFELVRIQSVVFRCQDHALKSFDYLALQNVLQQSNSWLYEMSISNCIFTLWLDVGCSTLDASTPHTSENTYLITKHETSSSQSSRFIQELGLASTIVPPDSSHWIIINITLGGISVSRCSLKSVLVEAHKCTKLTSSLLVGQNLHTLSWKIQGGLLFLEVTALVMCAHCFSSYLHCIKRSLSVPNESVKDVDNYKEAQETLHVTQQSKFDLPEATTIHVSQCSLVLVVEDDSGCFQEFVIEVDACVKLESANMLRKFIFDLSRMSILSQVLQDTAENENQTPHFSSSPDFTSGGSGMAQQRGGSCITHQNHILSHLVVFVAVEKPENSSLPLNQVWFGSGSLSGLDVTISLSEIQMISSIVSSLFSSSNEEASSYLNHSLLSSNQETGNSFEDKIPDGAIVAIQDVHQHMYLAVQGGDNKYSLVGTMHYSLVGERALFRVKHHKQRIWKSSVLWFSLVSLHAKNDSGEPLRLNYRSGSGFVDISSNNYSGFSLWRALSCESESYKGVIDEEICNKFVRGTFYLVNKKNDSAVAVIDGIPEFIRKPGNPFKFKVFCETTLALDIASDRFSVESAETHLHLTEHEVNGQTSELSGSLSCINIKIEKISLNIVHELYETKDRFPLLCGCISDSEVIVQILSNKTRITSKSRAVLYYFDAHRSLWKEFVHPVEIFTFYRSSLQLQGSETVQHGVPVHFYCRTQELDMSVTELSLDILLFVIGKLNLAGPFSVRSSTILANCCKVENQSGLNLLCHFYNNRNVTIPKRQSASVFLRNQASGNPSSESASLVTIQLSNIGSFATSELNISLLKTRALAWRTRIISLQDSRTYPGPFVVVDISRKSEDGLSLVVSPLIRIHNETEFSMELRFRRHNEDEDMFASVLLNKGDSIDDSMATFDAINLSGGIKKALMSLSVGNFLFSFRPKISDGLLNSGNSPSIEWSDELKAGKAVHLSGIFNKLGYKVRRAFSGESVKYSFSTACCTLQSEDSHATKLHFLIQSIGRDVPIIQPDKPNGGSEDITAAVALQEQKEIFILPTLRVSNLLHSEIHVHLSEKYQDATVDSDSIGKQATIQCGSTVDFYADPTVLYFNITLTEFSLSCKPVNTAEWIKKLLKNKKDVHFLDIDMDFGGGKHFASLRLSRGFRGILEASIFTPYSLKNDTEFPLFFSAPNQKSLTRNEVLKFGSSIPPELGLLLPPNSIRSWFSKSHKTRFKVLENSAPETFLDLDALSGVTEISLEIGERCGTKYITKFGVSTGSLLCNSLVSSQTVCMVPRHVVFNESEENINVRQCDLKDETAGIIHINSKQRTTLQLQTGTERTKEYSLFENIIRKHKSDSDTLAYIQFQLNDPALGWSGPVCIASLGRFFLKFKKQSTQLQALGGNVTEFAAVHVIEEGSTLGVHFHKPPTVNLPYRIENFLDDASITFYQKDSLEQEILGSEHSTFYVWDDLTLPHKLVVLISDMHLREVSLDKVRAWKPFHKLAQQRGLTSHALLEKRSQDQKTYPGQLNSKGIEKVGYEVYAEGPTRVLRVCEFSRSHKEDRLFQSVAKVQLRVSLFSVHLLEPGKQDLDEDDEKPYTPIVVARVGNLSLISMFTDQKKYNQISIHSLNVDQKWLGSPFAAMLRRHQSDVGDSNAPMLNVVFVLLSASSNVTPVEYLSIVLQPLNLNIDEETLMRVASFWRTSLSDSNTPSRQYYFDHFEVHPIKIIANFLPGDSYSSYNSSQETLRTLLHSVVKVPPIKNKTVELNGILVTHALITTRELFVKCAQHYSWYAMRAIYIAKGSHLLPPGFASIFDDSASSSLDIFFDPSRGPVNLPGFTLGTFKAISKCIGGKGFSGTKRYFGDLERTLKTVGSNVLFAAVTEVSDSVLKGAETSGFDGMVAGFHQGILKLAMEPSVLGSALMEGGPDRKVKLDRSPGIDESYIEGYLQAMLDTMYRQEYLRVRVIDDQVFLKNLPPSSALIDEIMDRVKGFLESRDLLKGDPSTSSRPLRHLRGENEWKFGPTVLTLCEHLFVSFAIGSLRKQTGKFVANTKWGKGMEDDEKAIVSADSSEQERKGNFVWKWGVGKFVLSGILAYVDGRLCRYIPNHVARRIVSGFLLSFVDKSDG